MTAPASLPTPAFVNGKEAKLKVIVDELNQEFRVKKPCVLAAVAAASSFIRDRSAMFVSTTARYRRRKQPCSH